MSGHEQLKRELLNELKPLMEQCVEGWLNNQKDTLLIQLIGMIENDKWNKEYHGEEGEPSVLIEPKDMRKDFTRPSEATHNDYQTE